MHAAAVPGPGRTSPAGKQAPAQPGTAAPAVAVTGEAADGETAAPAVPDLAERALAVLDAGDPEMALRMAREGLAALAAAGRGAGGDAAALLVASAEIEESMDRFSDAAVTAAEAVAVLEGVLRDGEDGEALLLWCRAQERLAGL